MPHGYHMQKSRLYRRFLGELAEAATPEDIRALAQRYPGAIRPDLGEEFFSRLIDLGRAETAELFAVAVQLTTCLLKFSAAQVPPTPELPLRFAEEALARLPSDLGLEDNIKLLGLLGDLYLKRDTADPVANLTAALHAYEMATNLCTPTTSRRLVSLLWEQQGDLYGELGSIGAGKRAEQQVASYEHALAVEEDPQRKAALMLDLGSAVEDLNNPASFQRARTLYETALHQIESGGYTHLRGRAFQLLGTWCVGAAADLIRASERERALGLFAEGRGQLEEALRLLDDDEPSRPHVCRSLAKAWIGISGERGAEAIQEAIRFTREAACLLENAGDDRFALLQCYCDIASWYETELDDLASARPWYELAYPLLLDWMQATDDTTTVLLANLYNHQVYRGLVRACADDGQISRAFEVAARSSHVIDRLIGLRMKPARGLMARNTWTHFRRLRKRYIQASHALDTISGESQFDRVVSVHREEQRVHALYRAALQEIEGKCPAVARLLRGEPLDPDSVANALWPGEALVTLYPTNAATIAFVIRGGPDATGMVSLPVASRGLMSVMGDVLFDWVLEYESYRAEGIQNVTRLEALRGALRKIVDLLSETLELSKLIPLLGGVHRLLLLAHYPLQFVPLHALEIEGSRTLADLFDVSYLPSANLLAAGRRKAPPARSSAMLGISDPRSYPPWHLSYSRLEAQAAGTYFKAPVLLQGDEADLDRVAAAMKISDLVHFSCHGVHVHGDVYRSALLLARNQQLTLEQVFNSLPDTRVRHVTLSACESGLADAFDFGDGGLSFSSAFLCAGVRSVVSSLWQIEERATTLVMSRFYEFLVEPGGSPPNALRRAQTWLRDATGEHLAAEAERLLSLGDPHVEPPGLRVWAERQSSPPRCSLKPYVDPFYWGAFYHAGL
jgi:CHAT domain-containing protein